MNKIKIYFFEFLWSYFNISRQRKICFIIFSYRSGKKNVKVNKNILENAHLKITYSFRDFRDLENAHILLLLNGRVEIWKFPQKPCMIIMPIR